MEIIVYSGKFCDYSFIFVNSQNMIKEEFHPDLILSYIHIQEGKSEYTKFH